MSPNSLLSICLPVTGRCDSLVFDENDVSACIALKTGNIGYIIASQPLSRQHFRQQGGNTPATLTLE
jgi:hypothetical protein